MSSGSTPKKKEEGEELHKKCPRGYNVKNIIFY
jgi:hypothetical protein